MAELVWEGCPRVTYFITYSRTSVGRLPSGSDILIIAELVWESCPRVTYYILLIAELVWEGCPQSYIIHYLWQS